MAAPAIPVRFMVVKVKVDGDADYTEIDGVRNITGFGGGSPQTADDTRLNSTVIETLYGLRNYGQVNLELTRNFDDAGQAILDAAATNAETLNFYFKLATGTKKYITFDAKCGELSTDFVQNNIAMTGTAQISVISTPDISSVDPEV